MVEIYPVYPMTDCENYIEKDEKICSCFKNHSIAKDCCKSCCDYVDLKTAGDREYERRQANGIKHS